MSDRIRLSDDGTLDTVLVCKACGAEARYTYPGGGEDDMADEPETYNSFVEWAIEDFEADHECNDPEQEGDD